MVMCFRRMQSMSGTGLLVAVAAGVLVFSLSGCGGSSGGEGSMSIRAYRLEVLGFEQPAKLPGDLGFRAPVPGDAYGAIEVRISKRSKPGAGQVDQLSQADLEVRTSKGERLSFVFVPGDLFLDPDGWAVGESRTGTLYMEVPAGVVVADVVLVSDGDTEQVVSING